MNTSICYGEGGESLAHFIRISFIPVGLSIVRTSQPLLRLTKPLATERKGEGGETHTLPLATAESA